MPFTLRSLFTSSTSKPDKHGAPQLQLPLPYDGFLAQHWPDIERRSIVTQYQLNTHMRQHWEQMLRKHPNKLELYRKEGYLEPITLAAVEAQTLAQRPQSWSSPYENRGEERLYYILEHASRTGSRLSPVLRTKVRGDNQRARIGLRRAATAAAFQSELLSSYASAQDAWRLHPQYNNLTYSAQVPTTLTPQRTALMRTFADDLRSGRQSMETMLLLDVSGSMFSEPSGRQLGLDGVMRSHLQPTNMVLVEHMVHRLLQHMVPRSADGEGVETVLFSSWAAAIGKLSNVDFSKEWKRRVRHNPVAMGGTQVMQGWQMAKQTYFERMSTLGHGRFDPTYGWQPTPSMPKLSLLVFLDGEASDMDEFELELLGEAWAFVTIVLVGWDGCPHHHVHATELERMCRSNPHLPFVDFQGRVLERWATQRILESVYPLDPPTQEEILDDRLEKEMDDDLNPADF